MTLERRPRLKGADDQGATQGSVPGQVQNLQANIPKERDVIVSHEAYSRELVQSLSSKYQDLKYYYDTNKEQILKKQNKFKMESQIMMQRIHKFISHMLVEAQREMHKNIEFH